MTEQTTASTTEIFTSSGVTIKPEWVDYNGHLNMAYYLVILDLVGDEFWQMVGLDDDYRAKTGCTTYAASCKIDYIKEIKPDATLTVQLALRELATKKFVLWMGIYNEHKILCASAELLILHVDQKGEQPKVADMPKDIFDKLEVAQLAHSGFIPPHPIGRPIELNRPK